MNKATLTNYLLELSQSRPIFHSEADFQHELACLLNRHEHSVRLEKPFTISGNHIPNGYLRTELDIEIDGTCALELKYKTHALKCLVQNEAFELKNQGAQNLGRFDLLDDARKVHWLKTAPSNKIAKGFTIFLTNDDKYWRDNAQGTMSEEFSLEHERTLRPGSVLNWVGNPTANSVGSNRLPPYAPIHIQFGENVNWEFYSDCSRYANQLERNKIFKFFILEV
jgi:hypothetical protein